MTAPRVRIGFVRRVHGIRGEIEIQTFDPASEAIRKGMDVWLVADGGEEKPPEDTALPRRVLAVRTGKDGVLVRLEGVDSRDGAEALRGLQVEIARDALPETEEGEFYLVDLIGYAVETVAGRAVGELTGALESGGPRLLDIASADGRRVLVPAVPPIVVSVEHERRVIVIDPPEGLLDL